MGQLNNMGESKMVREATVKAEISEQKNGLLHIKLIMDSIQKEDLLLEWGKTPSGIFSTVIDIIEEEESFPLISFEGITHLP